LWRVLRFLFGAAAVLGVGSYAYQVGVAASQARTDQLEADLVRFQRANLDLRDRIASIREQSTDAEAELQSMRERYSADIASGEAALLLTEIRTQLTAGVDPERLAFLIRAAGLNSACPSAPVTKRFMPRTQVSTGPVSSVRFDERITVAGAGEAARNDSGLPEAWYDPAKPVRLEFRTLDGTATTVERVVPFNHQMVVDGKEYRFSAVSGDPGFVEVTGQVCALPEPGDHSRASVQQADESIEPEPDAPLPPVLVD
jgi:hypothetical protein